MGSPRQAREDNETEQHLWEDVYLSQEEHITPEDDFQSSYFPAGPGDRSSQYVPGLGFSRYIPALRNLAPIRRKKKAENSLGVDESGLWAFLTYNWLTKYMDKAYTKGLTVEDIPSPCPQDTCDFNAQRFENLWQDELVEKGPQSASLNQVTWRFIRTRVLLSSLCMTLSICISFLSVALFMRYLLEYAESEDASPWTGLKWAVLLTVSEMVRVTLYANVWTTNYRTAIRLRTAFQAMLYRKILRVYSFEGKSIGELISLFSNDGQRIFDLVIMGPMIIGGPVSVLLAVIYVYWILGPWPILGLCSIFIFYPLQYFLSQFTGFLKRQVFSVTDNRLTVISEILSCIKFVKLYAWAKVYLRKISDIRRQELSLLRKVSYCNSFASSVSTSAPVIAGILTFLIHIIVEKNITASQAFPIMSYLLITMRLYVTYTFYGMSNIIEIGIICNRFKGVMLLNETTTSLSRPVDKSQAICIADGIFARHRNADQNIIYKMKKRKSLTVGLRRNTGTSEDLEKDLLNPPPPPSNYVEILFDINFFAPKGSLIGVCGPVGCGKSSLLAGILGHLPLTRGKLCREGLCAYVSQQPWLLNATLRENILLGEKFMARKYYDAIRCCDLGKDMDSLPAGDSTEIGERGVNLSGGQRQRVALARALYSDRDIYLLDDPLSAVDAEVGRHIFEECILSALRPKTVLFVSHQIQFLNQCDELIVMKEGRIVERGHPVDLLARDSEYKLMMDTFAQRTMSNDLGKEVPNEITSISVTQNGTTKNSTDKSKSGIDGVLIREEKTIHGALKSNTFMSYIAACGGFFVFSCLPLVMLFFVGTSAFTSWWLHIWINAGSGKVRYTNMTEGNTTFPEGSSLTPSLFENSTELYENTTELYETTTTEIYENSTELNFPNLTSSSLPENISHFSDNLIDNPQYYMYLYVYCASIGVIFLASLLRGVVFTEVTLRASSLIHQKLVDKMMKAYLAFFETTPIGRIQNLFSRDIDEVETKLPSTLESLIHGLWNISFSILFICFAFPYFVIALIFVCLIYFYVHKKFRSGLRELKRLDNTTRSPILSNVSATFHGIDSIHAFGKEKGFIYRFNASYDLNTTCSYMCSIANRWLALRVDAIAVFIMFLASLMVIFTHGLVPPSLAGLAIAYATTLCGAFQYTVRLVTDNEVKLISLERINSYLQYMEEEGGHGPKGVPKESWPELGSIRFKNVQLKYREELEPALKGISFHIRSEEKIGIVGRTGAGKSSIVAGLFRLVELSRGTIAIDNLDIANLELTALRSRLSIIPQDPVLFSGSVRSNLDPADEHSDEEIWSVLEKTSLKTRISLCPDKLDSKVIFNGDNFSTGEKQLLCLARALLRKSKILVLDEATSGLDHETERIIQNTLFAEMKYCTVIIIAHRLETIKSCHRVLVMEDGKVAEFDEPKTLLQDSNSLFFRLMSASQHNGPLP